MTDAVFVTGLSLHAYHGVMQHEGRVGQTFSLDLVLDTDLTEASRSDKLADTVGYDQVVEIASKAFGARRYRLVEAAAGAVAAAVLDRFPRVARAGSRSTSPTRRSRPPLPMSGSPSCALASVSWLRRRYGVHAAGG
jgi:dihydroneopterin aldolase